MKTIKKKASLTRPAKQKENAEQEQTVRTQRLSIQRKTLRRLYLHCGNRCAFPKCRETMMDEDGNFVGEICHIEAAMPGGERFNTAMTDDERRAFRTLFCFVIAIMSSQTM